MRSVLWTAVGCALAGAVWAQSPASIQASGYQPDWTLDIRADQLTFSPNLQLQEPPPKVLATVSAPARASTPAGDTLTYTTTTATKGELLARFAPQLCTDAIQGSLHPYTVEVLYAGNRYAGCGGEPAALLQYQVWVVEDIAARGVIDGTRITLQFGTTGEVSGRVSCTPLEGSYQTNGGGLRLSAAAKPVPVKSAPAKDGSTSPETTAPPTDGVAPTRKICPPALRRQDAAFFEVLNAVSRWDLTADGALALGTVDGRRIVARRQ